LLHPDRSKALIIAVLNGLCLMLLSISLTACLLGWQSRHAETYVVYATRAGRWWLGEFSCGGFAILTWRGEPAGVRPQWNSVPDRVKRGADPLIQGGEDWHGLGFKMRSGDLVGVPAGRLVSEADPTLKRHVKDPMNMLDPDFDGPWPGWGAYLNEPPSNGAWLCSPPSGSSCIELEGSIWSAAAVGAIFPLLWLALRLSRSAWMRRRRRLGLCRWCGYDLTLNQSGACPECGKVIPVRC
jgi:hypothetical protein